MRFHEIIQPKLEDFPVIQDFIAFAAQQLELETLPQIELLVGNTLGPSFGSYQPGAHEIKIEVGGRHPVDIMRTLAHEMVHYSQDVLGQLEVYSGQDGSPHEDEANSKAGVIMRLYGKANPEIFSMDAIEA